MARVGLFLRVLVKDGERALLLRDGRCVRVLEPGLHRLFDPLGALVSRIIRIRVPSADQLLLGNQRQQPDKVATLLGSKVFRSFELDIRWRSKNEFSKERLFENAD